MSKRPWMKFYPTDWQSDPKLRMCSLAARGLWMEMLCIMHEAGGYLTVNGKALEARQIAVLCGADVAEALALLAELKEADVVSEKGGLLVSRRMRRDCAKAAKQRENGKRGGNPALTLPTLNNGKITEIGGSLNLPLKAEDGLPHEPRDIPALNPEEAPADKPGVMAQSPESRFPDSMESESGLSDESPGAVRPRPLKERIFGPALDWLAEKSGKPPGRLRSLVGRWCRDHGDKEVLEALVLCSKAAPVDPVPWITRRLAARRDELAGEDRKARGLEQVRAAMAEADRRDGIAS